MKATKNVLILLLAGLYLIPFYFLLPDLTAWLWLAGGLLAGLILMWLDEHVFYHYYVAQTPRALELISRSPIFLVAYIPLAVFAITSSTNILGVGVILGIGLTLVVEVWIWRHQPPEFKQRFLQHLASQVPDRAILQLVWLITAVFAGLTVIAWL